MCTHTHIDTWYMHMLRAATELQHSVAALLQLTYICSGTSAPPQGWGPWELQQSCNRAATELQQSCNRAAEEPRCLQSCIACHTLHTHTHNTHTHTHTHTTHTHTHTHTPPRQGQVPPYWEREKGRERGRDLLGRSKSLHIEIDRLPHALFGSQLMQPAL